MSKEIQMTASLDGKTNVLDSVQIKNASFYEFLSLRIWGFFPSWFQRFISGIYANVFNLHISKFLIKPYCRFHYEEADYLSQFKPPSGRSKYLNFQDFFVRQFKELPKNSSPTVWPCEGLLCDMGFVYNIQKSNVKGDLRAIHHIFGVRENEINKDYVFTNVFLHNKNYHRIHAPVNGIITRIQHIKGDLVILRPWFYKDNPSIPAFRNERINIDITDDEHQKWHLSIVGGPAVGTIELPEHIQLGSRVSKIDEIALFYLGSTCCMVAPAMPKHHVKNSLVYMGDTY